MTTERVDAMYVVASSLTGRVPSCPMLSGRFAMKHRLPSISVKAIVVAVSQ